jgi:hypothetical protein
VKATAKRQRREYTIASPGELSKERAGRILFVSRAPLGRQRAASIFMPEIPDKWLQLVFALRSLVAFHVGLGVSTTVHLVRTKGWVALSSFVGVVYVRESVSCCRPLLCVFTSVPTPSAPRKVSLKCPACLFFVVPPQGFFEGRRLTGLFFLIWAELLYTARRKPKNGELGGFCVILTHQR